MDLTQQQIDVLSQNLRKKHLKIELLDQDMITIDSVEGVAIGGSITANANNDIRRSGNVEIAIPSTYVGETLFDRLDGFTIEAGGKIWLDKNIKIYIGIEDIGSVDESVVWYKLGVFLIDNPTRSFSAQNHIISFSCIDLMAKLTGQRQGQLTGQTTLIEKGYYSSENGNSVYVKTRLADAIIHTITELAGFSQYTIYPIPTQYEYLPYDIKMGVGSTVYSLLKELMNIIPTWEVFFDLDGILVVRPTPSGENDIVFPIDESLYISNELTVDFGNVKNQIVVYGRVNSLDYFTSNEDDVNVSYKDNSDGITSTLQLRYSAINTDAIVISATTFGFRSLGTANLKPINRVEIYINTSLLVSAPLVKFENSTMAYGKEEGHTMVGAMSILPDDIYFIRIYSGSVKKNSDDIEVVDFSKTIIFEFMGKQAVSHCLVNENPQSPFYINKGIKQTNYYAGVSRQGVDNPNNYALHINNIEEINSIENGTIITFMSHKSNLAGQLVDVYSSYGTRLVANIPIVQNMWDESSGSATRPMIVANKLHNDYTIWSLKYEKTENYEWFVLLGRNPYTLTKICSGGEYDNIYADQLAYERCLYELFLASNMNDSITLGIVPNYLLDVNYKFKYNTNSAIPVNLKEVFGNGEGQDYIIKQISYPLGVSSTAQTISAIRIYDDTKLV